MRITVIIYNHKLTRMRLGTANQMVTLRAQRP